MLIFSKACWWTPAAVEALRKWDGGHAPNGRAMERGLAPFPLWGPGVLTLWKFFENIVSNLCNMVAMVHFGVKICILK